MELTGRKGEFQISGTGIRIWAAAAGSSEIQGLVRSFLTTGSMTLYRGMSAYHPNFKSALNGSVQPLGTGGSSFDTGSSAWTAWQWDYDAAVGIAVSVRGMDEKDRIEKVQGYDRADDDFVVGVVLTIAADRDDSLTFYNSTEVQVLGAKQAKVDRLKMGTLLAGFRSLQHYKGRTIADLMPDPGD